jgi:hypothetical protein
MATDDARQAVEAAEF